MGTENALSEAEVEAIATLKQSLVNESHEPSLRRTSRQLLHDFFRERDALARRETLPQQARHVVRLLSNFAESAALQAEQIRAVANDQTGELDVHAVFKRAEAAEQLRIKQATKTTQGWLQSLSEQLHSQRSSPLSGSWLIAQNLAPRIDALHARGHEETALDLIYDTFDELMQRGQFALCDALLLELDPTRLETVYLVAILTATLPAKALLPDRPEFVASCRDLLSNRDPHRVDSLLDGLA